MERVFMPQFSQVFRDPRHTPSRADMTVWKSAFEHSESAFWVHRQIQSPDADMFLSTHELAS